MSVEVKNSNTNAEAIWHGLQSSGLISSDGTVDFDSNDNDTVYVNGYQIRINKNNGNGGTIHISAIGG